MIGSESTARGHGLCWPVQLLAFIFWQQQMWIESGRSQAGGQDRAGNPDSPGQSPFLFGRSRSSSPHSPRTGWTIATVFPYWQAQHSLRASFFAFRQWKWWVTEVLRWWFSLSQSLSGQTLCHPQRPSSASCADSRGRGLRSEHPPPPWPQKRLTTLFSDFFPTFPWVFGHKKIRFFVSRVTPWRLVCPLLYPVQQLNQRMSRGNCTFLPMPWRCGRNLRQIF